MKDDIRRIVDQLDAKQSEQTLAYLHNLLAKAESDREIHEMIGEGSPATPGTTPSGEDRPFDIQDRDRNTNPGPVRRAS